MEQLNNVLLVGKVISKDFAFTGTKHGYEEKFYEFKVNIARTSGTIDTIPIICSEKYLFDTPVNIGDRVKVEGSIHTIRHTEEDGRKYRTMYVYVRDIVVTDEQEDINQIELCGSVFKYTRSRITKDSQRSVTDMTLITERPNGKKDFIATIAWGRNATLAGKRKEGDVIKLIGRIQSRQKYIAVKDVTVTTHEVSVVNMEVISQAEGPAQNTEEIPKVEAPVVEEVKEPDMGTMEATTE